MMISEKTSEFDKWFKKLKDLKAKAKILYRTHLAITFGGIGLSQLRIHFAKGYRIYFVEKDNVIVILLAGGDIHTEQRHSTQRKNLGRDQKVKSNENIKT